MAFVLLAASSNALSAPTAKLDYKPVDKLVAAAQSVLQQAKENSTTFSAEDITDDDRHRGARFVSPVDGYFIQARIRAWTSILSAARIGSFCGIKIQAIDPSRSEHPGLCLSLDSTRTLVL